MGSEKRMRSEKSASMKSWLELVPISERVHRRRSRMTRVCIMLAVSLVMTIFGMADMEIRNQTIQTLQTDGGWHASFREITQEQAALISARPQVKAGSWYGIYNYGLDEGWRIGGVETAVVGVDEAFAELFPGAEILEGSFPSEDGEAVFSENARQRLGLSIGDSVTLSTPFGASVTLTVSGFCGTLSWLNRQDSFGVFLNTASFRRIAEAAGDGEEECWNSIYMVKFRPFCNIRKNLEDIRKQLGLAQEQLSENVKLLGLMGQSSDSYMLRLMETGIVLAVLVAALGVLMITGSLNSSVAQRTEFFGLLRCLGATRAQVSRFVRKEALIWCRTAVPAGLLAGTAVIWALCAFLRRVSPGLFAEMPVFSISWIGLAAGAAVGVFTVLLASGTPAKRAAAVSPLAAVSGNGGTVYAAGAHVAHAKSASGKRANTGLFGVETALGVHHALGSRKNFFLLAGSYALSILLFLAFSVLPDLGKCAVNPLDASAPDLSIASADDDRSLPRRLAERLSEDEAVKRVYARSFAYGIPASCEGAQGSVCLYSYEENQFAWAEEELLGGHADRKTSMEAVRNGEGVLAVYGYEGQLSLAEGSLLFLQLPEGERQVTVSGVLSDSPYTVPGETQLICSEELFYELTGEQDYTVIDLQLVKNASDEDVQRIRGIAEEMAGADNLRFSDRRLSNSEAVGAWYSLMLFVYGFLAVIALISVVHIINSTDMSVTARIREYGRMRAVGMTGGQLVRMVAAETLTCSLTGALAGCAAGLLLHRVLYESLVTAQWGLAWQFPAVPLLVILAATAVSVLLAVRGPSRRIRALSVTETIGAQ